MREVGNPVCDCVDMDGLDGEGWEGHRAQASLSATYWQQQGRDQVAEAEKGRNERGEDNDAADLPANTHPRPQCDYERL
jgi:hypothetical protein